MDDMWLTVVVVVAEASSVQCRVSEPASFGAAPAPGIFYPAPAPGKREHDFGIFEN